ncbi:MAG TPA: hypothetical protein VKX17_16500 [Planctomycetota bacterium]|nr:hypothetical protein [Planctomycetota bacterium]
MFSSRFYVLAFAAILALPVLAEVTEDAIKLAQNGVTEDVIVAWCENQNVRNLTAQDVLRMKDGKVPDRAIAALLRTAARQTVPLNTNNTEYVATPSTTYVYTSPYYSGYDYPYYYSYGYPYYRSYGYWGPSLGFGFRFGGGHGGGFHHHH